MYMCTVIPVYCFLDYSFSLLHNRIHLESYFENIVQICKDLYYRCQCAGDSTEQWVLCLFEKQLKCALLKKHSPQVTAVGALFVINTGAEGR